MDGYHRGSSSHRACPFCCLMSLSSFCAPRPEAPSPCLYTFNVSSRTKVPGNLSFKNPHCNLSLHAIGRRQSGSGFWPNANYQIPAPIASGTDRCLLTALVNYSNKEDQHIETTTCTC